MQNVLQVVTSLVFGRILVAQAVDLRKSCDARPYAEALAMPIAVVPHLFRTLGSRSDQAHIPAKHVEQLGQFRETGLLHQELIEG